MNIIPEQTISQRIVNEKNQKEKAWMNTPNKYRKNNRKSNRARCNQYIRCVDDSVFPPRLYTKVIKHFIHNN